LQLEKYSVLEVEIVKKRLGTFGVKPKFGHDVGHCQCSKSCLNGKQNCLNRHQNCLKLPKDNRVIYLLKIENKEVEVGRTWQTKTKLSMIDPT
jgi:hypothetical protein